MELKLDLQLFAEAEKTEKPTPKKRKDVREEGQVLQSKEVTSAFVLLSVFLGIKLFGKFILNYLVKYISNIYGTIENVDELFYENNIINNSLKTVGIFFILIAPIMVASFIAGLGINYLQVGVLFTTKSLKLDLNRINPVEGFKRLFSKRALAELIKSILKIALIGYVAYSYIKKNLLQLIDLQKYDLASIINGFSKLAFNFIIRIIGVLILLSFFDYLFQWREHEKRLMMTKQEVKEEYKQTEGDPLIKSKIKEKQRRIAMSRMIQEIPKADVIITNPTHIAIAIQYERDLHEAPYVLAKGINIIAENIKKAGIKHSIPMVENKPLARTLYDTVDVGDFIPEELYEAVAEVLAYVYSLKDSF